LVWTPWPWAADAWVYSVTADLAQHSLDHPSFWVRYFIQQALLPNAGVYVGLGVVLELLAGVSLTVGLLTVPGGLLAALLSLSGGVLAYYQGDLSGGFYLLQGVSAGVFMLTRAGRRWGFDDLLAGVRPRALLW
jgi:hypothetical protein